MVVGIRGIRDSKETPQSLAAQVICLSSPLSQALPIRATARRAREALRRVELPTRILTFILSTGMVFVNRRNGKIPKPCDQGSRYACHLNLTLLK